MDEFFVNEVIEDNAGDHGAEFFLGTVSAVTNTGIRVKLDGQNEAMTKGFKMLKTGSTPDVGARVLVLKQSGTYIVLGAIVYPS